MSEETIPKRRYDIWDFVFITAPRFCDAVIWAFGVLWLLALFVWNSWMFINWIAAWWRA
jgi:hypothetical protein